MLFLHGIGGHSGQWSPIADGLTTRATTLCWDARNYGGSHGPTVAGMADFADDLLALLDLLDLERVIAVGHSMGGRILIEAACRAPERFAGLVLSGAQAAHLAHMTEAEREIYLGRRRAMFDGETVTPEIAARVADSVLAPDAPEAARTALSADFQALRRDGYLSALNGSIGWDRRGDLPALTMPVALVTGTHDSVCPPSESRAIAEALPDARLTLLDGIGHMPQLEAPEACIRLIDDFLARHASGASTTDLSGKAP
ncbi:alpha/beta fold hydrolase [Tropicimonas sediminicola]|uniref:Pimeloyl-ACP methyl ester carboxylesterase n=1 Tax=Tropicimonas sediminicola TaxID=1031541 RepID=A0A239CZ99_9RHOB|nr:alpha/beta hydrolase [Tropicimonas sediminicola]SNS25259.1 Pimeloyl-ACP methyl ester carboxylesterase [Tropicimonas sediminicola]